MMDSHDGPSTSNGPLMGPSCSSTTVALLIQYWFSVVVFFYVCFFCSLGTNCCYMQVLTLTEPNKYRVYARGHSKSIALFSRLVISSDDEHDLEYIPPGTLALARVAYTTTSTPRKVAPGVVTTS